MTKEEEELLGLSGCSSMGRGGGGGAVGTRMRRRHSFVWIRFIFVFFNLYVCLSLTRDGYIARIEIIKDIYIYSERRRELQMREGRKKRDCR